MSRCRNFAFGNVQRLAHSILLSQRASYSEINNYGRRYMVGISHTFYRLYSQKLILNKDYSSCKLLKASHYSWRKTGSKGLHALSASKALSHHAHIAWRRLYSIPSYTGAVLPPLYRTACAVTFSLSRSNVVYHGLFALVFGKLVLTQTSLVEAEAFPAGDSLYARARNGHIDLTSILYSLIEGVMLFFRALYLMILFTPCISMAPFADSLGVEYRKRWLSIVHRTLEKAGPAFIKWGQWAATRPDLFPGDVCTELTKLHMKAPAHSYAYSKKTIENAFGRKLHDIFEKFEEEPVASGSVAQVHRAILQSHRRDQHKKPILVAVKVRHPGVGEAIRRDFALINLVAKISKFMPTLKWLRLDESVQQFAVFMMSQVDLAREAANLSRFSYNFRKCKDVSFPKPLYPLVHPAVLVETFEHGKSVSHYVDELEGNDSMKSALARIGTQALLKMLLVDNFVHADMHPGNILIRESHNIAPSKPLFKMKPHVVFLDVGMTAELSRRDRITLLDYFKAVAKRDGRTVAKCTLKLSKHQRCPNPEAFIQEVEQTFSYWDSPEGGLFHPGECMQQILEQVRRHRVNIDGNVCTVMVTMLVLEGWQRKLDPEYDVMHTLQTLLFKADLAESLSYTIERLMAP